MRILAVSDIHENVGAVRMLRSREVNRFDAVVVAGDIGNRSAAEILEILATFGCPVLYVYGNWDHRLRYDQAFAFPCTHLHLRVFRCDGYSFVGFSGLPTHWGMNPIASELLREVRERHRAIVDRYEDCKTAVKAAVHQIESDYEPRIAELAGGKRRRRASADHPELQKLGDAYRKQIRKAWVPLDRLAKTKEYSAYARELHARRPEILARNRAALVDAIAGSGAVPQKVVVLTHERLYRTGNDMPGVRLFLFGHRHGFADSSFQGARFVNVSALDQAVIVKPAGKKRAAEEDYHNINTGNYVIIETGDSSAFEIRCVRFEPSFEGWELVGNFRIHGAPWAEEST